MLKTKLFAAAALTAVAGLAQAAIPADLKFDGYCDGMTGLTATATTAGGTWANLDCAGTNAALGGPRGKAKGASDKGYIMGSYGANVYGNEFVWEIKVDGTWNVYSASGGGLINSGTWSAGFPLANGGKASVAK